MTQLERLRYLVRGLAREQGIAEIPDDPAHLRALLRALMNVRRPAPIDGQWLAVQDEFLRLETVERGVVDGEALPAVPSDRRLVLWRGDITRLRVDAIVNAANSALLGCFHPNHGCIDNAIHSAAGLELREACRRLMDELGRPEPVGQAKVTPGFNLPARHVIHTVGPVVSGELTARHCEALARCYRACLAAAQKSGCRSIAFCCISTGEFHFPGESAARIAVETVRRELSKKPTVKRVIFNVFRPDDERFYRELLG
ncbi:protein-ADP-ribose hydrolase [Feifania hominis]|uniref:Protein-ADP-ribose hydrolase n=1 Tax=Feifania hominis TaxID=2763660 RepID=A0A926DEI3_9FIRM|nr:protein-ADP-ribose hydrolase [Feifania hominis]MBC8536334.1 protein-ADP-ribose hydrolase [Feifania hominis]